MCSIKRSLNERKGRSYKKYFEKMWRVTANKRDKGRIEIKMFGFTEITNQKA